MRVSHFIGLIVVWAAITFVLVESAKSSVILEVVASCEAKGSFKSPLQPLPITCERPAVTLGGPPL